MEQNDGTNDKTNDTLGNKTDHKNIIQMTCKLQKNI